ncbi:MAG: hypothetical protein JRH19_18020 [Deltaproteobacteria bacterium]|nr:hypothetical protein [Deltaproteobacteria bacterium]
MTDEKKPSLEELRRELREPLSAALGSDQEPYSIELLCEPKDVADDPAKLLVTSRGSLELAVVLVAAPAGPGLVRRGMRRAAEAKELLGERLGSVILEPLGEGDLRGLSYTILPYRRPFGEGAFARRYWRRALRSTTLDWLAEVTEATLGETGDTEIAEGFERPLAHLATLEAMDDSVRRAADGAVGRLKSGEWRPKSVLMHGDLWLGNMLRAVAGPGAGGRRRGYAGRPLRGRRRGYAGRPLRGRRREFPFVIIDWPGSIMRGYAMYDLIRLAASMGLRGAGFGHEVRRHCDILGSHPASAMDYLAASLGHLGMNLGEFPSERYCESSVSCFNQLRSALG